MDRCHAQVPIRASPTPRASRPTSPGRTHQRRIRASESMRSRSARTQPPLARHPRRRHRRCSTQSRRSRAHISSTRSPSAEAPNVCGSQLSTPRVSRRESPPKASTEAKPRPQQISAKATALRKRLRASRSGRCQKAIARRVAAQYPEASASESTGDRHRLPQAPLRARSIRQQR